ncbi:MAG: hypothetical protein LDL11_03825 [Desulfarculus sp.]|nr:hypothetical protein [Desulfarculus sp.]
MYPLRLVWQPIVIFSYIKAMPRLCLATGRIPTPDIGKTKLPEVDLGYHFKLDERTGKDEPNLIAGWRPPQIDGAIEPKPL